MRKLKVTVLMLSLVTVMAGAAVAPALGPIGEYFKDADPLLIKLIVTLPALFIIFTSLSFNAISSKLTSKTIAVLGLVLYIVGGCGAGFVDSIYLLLVFRSILGIGVGLIMPLSTGLIAYFFDKKEQPKLMGYSTAMNNLGGIIALALSGVLVSLNWRYSFAIYLLGLVILIMVIRVLPKEKKSSAKSSFDMKSIRKILPYGIAMFLTMIVFYAVPANFSMVMTQENLVPTSFVGVLMSVQNITSFIIGLAVSVIISKLGRFAKYFAPGTLALGFFSLTFSGSIAAAVLGLFLIGVGLGIMVPLLFSQISFHMDKEKMTSAMSIMSAMMYLGQFLSPILIDGIQSQLGLTGLQTPFYIAMVLAVVLLVVLIWVPIYSSNRERK
jgi:MFS family permease